MVSDSETRNDRKDLIDMSTKKSLVALAAAALASMAFASMASASGTVVDTENGQPMQAGEKMHYEGWWKLLAGGWVGSFECHVTVETEAENDTTGKVTKFDIPDTSKCTGTGMYSGCTLTSHQLGSIPTVTATASDFDISNLKLKNTFAGCSLTNTTLTFSSLTFKPLKTGTSQPTGTTAKVLGETAAAGEPIAGMEIEGSANTHTEQHIIFTPTTLNSNITVAGELAVTGSDRCTWQLKA